MKRRKDYLKIEEQFFVLERSMKQGEKQYDALCKRLEEIGKNNLEITKTQYWHWFIEKDYFPESYFYATPPIGGASESDRILITGTKVETRDMYEILQGLETYQRVMKEIQSKRKKLLAENISIIQMPIAQSNNLVIATKSLEQYSVQPEYVFCGSVGSFWESFFGEEKFLDYLDKISIPSAIIGTGYMRNYNQYGGETINVKERLEKIALVWDIPIQIIESWAVK